MRLFLACLSLACAALVFSPASANDDPELLFKKSTVWRFLSPDAKLAVYAIDDPLVENVACHFTLEEAPARITSAGDVPFWSLSIYNRRGENIYSFNDRTAINEELDLVVADPVQMIELKKTAPPELANSVMIEADMGEGFVVVRSFVPDRSFQAIVEDFLRGATCEPLVEP